MMLGQERVGLHPSGCFAPSAFQKLVSWMEEAGPEPQVPDIHAGRIVFWLLWLFKWKNMASQDISSHTDSFHGWGGKGEVDSQPSPAPLPICSLTQAAPISSESREAKGDGSSFKIRPVRSPYLQLGFIRRAGKPYPTP